jgi:hypothetical protein
VPARTPDDDPPEQRPTGTGVWQVGVVREWGLMPLGVETPV